MKWICVILWFKNRIVDSEKSHSSEVVVGVYHSFHVSSKEPVMSTDTSQVLCDDVQSDTPLEERAIQCQRLIFSALPANMRAVKGVL